MKGKRIGQWALLAVICLSFSIGETFAQKKRFCKLGSLCKRKCSVAHTGKKREKGCVYGKLYYRGVGADSSGVF